MMLTQDLFFATRNLPFDYWRLYNKANKVSFRIYGKSVPTIMYSDGFSGNRCQHTLDAASLRDHGE
jgi:hypothetical protein